MRFMLDTNTCIFLIRRKHAGLLRRIVSCNPGDLGISAITLAELEYSRLLFRKKNSFKH